MLYTKFTRTIHNDLNDQWADHITRKIPPNTQRRTEMNEVEEKMVEKKPCNKLETTEIRHRKHAEGMRKVEADDE